MDCMNLSNFRGKLLSPERRRGAVEHARRKYGVSEREACRVPRQSEQSQSDQMQADCFRKIAAMQKNRRSGGPGKKMNERERLYPTSGWDQS